MDKAKSQSYKYCLVPFCLNTTFQTPNKIFFNLPINTSRRMKWLKTCSRDNISPNSVLFVCEDHFNIEEDMENYVRFKLMGGQKKLKEDVVPHIFGSQSGRKRTLTQSPKVSATKVKRQRVQKTIDSDSRNPQEAENEYSLSTNKSTEGLNYENEDLDISAAQDIIKIEIKEEPLEECANPLEVIDAPEFVTLKEIENEVGDEENKDGTRKGNPDNPVLVNHCKEKNNTSQMTSSTKDPDKYNEESLEKCFKIMSSASVNKHQEKSECEIFGSLVATKISKYSSQLLCSVQDDIMKILLNADKSHRQKTSDLNQSN